MTKLSLRCQGLPSSLNITQRSRSSKLILIGIPVVPREVSQLTDSLVSVVCFKHLNLQNPRLRKGFPTFVRRSDTDVSSHSQYLALHTLYTLTSLTVQDLACAHTRHAGRDSSLKEIFRSRASCTNTKKNITNAEMQDRKPIAQRQNRQYWI
jgi:hypothetical protein